MFRNFLLTAFRNQWRNKVNSLINIASLALGLTVFAFAFLYVKKEFSYDRSWPDAERIHRLTLEQRGLPGSADGVFSTVIARAYPSITEYFSEEIDASTRINTLTVQQEDSEAQNYKQLLYADPGFTKIFRLQTVQGDIEEVFLVPGYVALEESYALALGEEGQVGSRLSLKSGLGAQIEYQVAAIYRLPKNISPGLNFQLVSLIDDSSSHFFKSPDNGSYYPNWDNSSQIWLTLKPGITTRDFNALQPVFIDEVVTAYDKALGSDRKISDHLLYTWQKITDMHFNPVSTENYSGSSFGNRNRVLTFAAVGLLILLVGCSNSVSLSLAIALERRREIGVRKAIGAVQPEIMIQFLGESILLALLALIPAVGMFKLLQPAFIKLMPFSIAAMDVGLTDALLLLGITVLVGLGSGAYPALVLSSVKPEAVLKSGAGMGGKNRQTLRSFLVAVQFCFASMLLIGTAALYIQLAITRYQPMGFSGDNLVTVFLGNDLGFKGSALSEELKKLAGIQAVTPGFMLPNQYSSFANNSQTLVRKSGDFNEVKLQFVSVSQATFDLFGIPVLAGRNYDDSRDLFNPETKGYGEQGAANGAPLVLNRAAVVALGFSNVEEAVDQLIYARRQNSSNPGEVVDLPQRIIGVVEDSMLTSLKRRPGPEMYSLIGGQYTSLLYLKYEDSVEKSIQETIREAIKAATGVLPQGMIFIENLLDDAFRQERNESRLLLICGVLALLLACMGLFGLASFSMERNVKEIGVRKVLGSTVASLMTLFLWRFSRPVLLANLLAWPVAAYFVLEWIKQFPYQLEKIWLLPLCLGAAALVLLIAILTVSVITARAAAAKPVQSLRYE